MTLPPLRGRAPVLFVDFDGTITERDCIVAIMEAFAPPGWEEIKDAILSRRISVRKGVGKLFALLPSAKRDEIAAFVRQTVRIRAGFDRFVAYAAARGVEWYVTSGGIDFFVYPLLEPYRIPRERIYCNGSDVSGERIRITWPHPCDEACESDCGLCKASIIRRFDPARHYRIVVGDSVTDLAGAQLADLVIAREYLLERCRELGMPHVPFATFDDVVAVLARLMDAEPTPCPTGKGEEGESW